jgi:ankyrin repeat protein
MPNNNNIFNLINENNINKLESINSNVLKSKNNDGNTPLMYAILKDKIDIAKLLIDKGCNLDMQNNDGDTALMLSVKYSKDIPKLLIESGCNLNLQDKAGNTPLMISILRWRVDIARLLIENDCDLNLQNSRDYTALMFAVGFNDINTTKLLIENERCDLNKKNKDKDTALMIAIKYKNIEIAQLLINKSNNNKNDVLKLLDEKGYTLKNGIIFDKIININLSQNKNGIALKNKNEDKKSLLFAAIKYKKYIVATEIIQYYIFDLYIRNIDGNTPLMYSIKVSENKSTINKISFFSSNEYKLIKLLINRDSNLIINRRRGSNLNVQNNEGNTALMIAIKDNKKTDIIKLLIDSGCNLDIQNNDNESALYLAIQGKHFNTINMLLDKGCYFDESHISLLRQIHNDSGSKNIRDKAKSSLKKMKRILEKQINEIKINEININEKKKYNLKKKKEELKGYNKFLEGILS